MIRFKTYSEIRPVSREVIEDALRNNNGKDVIFVAPEFAKAQIEREVLAYKQDKSQGNGAIDAGDKVLTLSSSLVSGDVLSFRKLAGNILDDLGTNYVAEGGEIMLRNAIYNILANKKYELKAFSTLSSRIDYINLMIALLGDFSRYGVGPEDIEKAIEALDDKTFELFKKGLTATLNQVDGDWATSLMKQYQITNVREGAMFTAALRPSFESWRDMFISRTKYDTNCPQFDEVLKETGSFILFQENLMQYFEWLGVSPAESIGLIKKISKKKIKPSCKTSTTLNKLFEDGV